MNRQEYQQCKADRKSELHLEAVKLNWSSFSPLFKWSLYPQQVQKGTSEEKTNTTKKKYEYDCVHTDSDCCRVSYRPSNLLRSYGGLSTKTKDGRITGSSPTQTIRCAHVGVKAILLFHTLLFCTNTIPPALPFFHISDFVAISQLNVELLQIFERLSLWRSWSWQRVPHVQRRSFLTEPGMPGSVRSDLSVSELHHSQPRHNKARAKAL